MTRLLLFVLLLAPLAGCATLSEGECRTGDWRGVGYVDGTNGRTPSYLAKHAKACAEYGIAPDRSAWEAGRQAGLPLYCTPANAWEEGADGKRLSPVCPPELTDSLLGANKRGLIYHRILTDIRETERSIDRLEDRLVDTNSEAALHAALLSERAFLRLELLSLRTELLTYRH